MRVLAVLPAMMYRWFDYLKGRFSIIVLGRGLPLQAGALAPGKREMNAELFKQGNILTFTGK